MVVDNTVILRVGSLCDGARRFPLLARAGAYPRAGFAALRPLAARVWLSRRSFPCAPAEVGSLQATCSRGPSRLQKAILQARGERAGAHPAHRSLPPGELDRPGVPADAAANL